MYQFIEEARENIEEYRRSVEFGYNGDYLVDKIERNIQSMETEYSSLQEKYQRLKRELAQYRKKYGDLS